MNDYVITSIKEATAPKTRAFNFAGIVVETSLPKFTQGTDVFCRVKIIDESLPVEGIYVHFFAQSMDKLPYVHSIGDIIVVSHVKLDFYNGAFMAVYRKASSMFALFKGKINVGDVVPYQSCAKYKAREQDRESVKRLRQWLLHHRAEVFTDALWLREIKEPGCYDFIAKILHVCKVAEDKWMLFVYDRTYMPSLPVEAPLEDNMNKLLPLQFEFSSLSRDILCTFPSRGTILRITIDTSNIKYGVSSITTNRWVKLSEIKFEHQGALWHSQFQKLSRLSYLPDDENIVLERRRIPRATLPRPSDIAETDHPEADFVTLRKVVTYREVTYTYKCVVRVVAIYPWDAKDFRKPPDNKYEVILTLEDPTARVNAVLLGKDGIKFFGNDQSVDQLTRKRDKLLGIDGEDGGQTRSHVSRNPPWIQCILKSYYFDKSDQWGTRIYGIFKTTLS